MFSPYGAIHSTWVKHGGEGDRQWSIGFINYYDQTSAGHAIQAYNGMQLPNGLSLKVVLKNASQGGKGK